MKSYYKITPIIYYLGAWNFKDEIFKKEKKFIQKEW